MKRNQVCLGCQAVVHNLYESTGDYTFSNIEWDKSQGVDLLQKVL